MQIGEELPKPKKMKPYQAEVAAEWIAYETYGCVVTETTRRSMYGSIDIFACDVVGKRKDGSHVYIQVTTGKAPSVSKRKRKLEAIPWHVSDIVMILQEVNNEFVTYKYNKTWSKSTITTPIKPEWLSRRIST